LKETVDESVKEAILKDESAKEAILKFVDAMKNLPNPDVIKNLPNSVPVDEDISICKLFGLYSLGFNTLKPSS